MRKNGKIDNITFSHNIDGDPIKMCINNESKNPLEISLVNLSFEQNRNKYVQRILVILTIYLFAIFIFSSHLLIHGVFGLVLLVNIYLLRNLVEFGKQFEFNIYVIE